MIQDVFVESLVVRKNGINGVIFTATAIVVAIILITVINVYPWLNWGSDVTPVTSFISVALIFGLVYILKNQHKEYEFEMSNDYFECAAIKGKNKREDLVSFSIKECEYIGPVTSDRYNSDLSSAQKQRTKRFVFCVTGSEKSEPCGETAPIIVTEPSLPPSVLT